MKQITQWDYTDKAILEEDDEEDNVGLGEDSGEETKQKEPEPVSEPVDEEESEEVEEEPIDPRLPAAEQLWQRQLRQIKRTMKPPVMNEFA